MPFRRRVDLPNLDWLLRFAESRRPHRRLAVVAGCEQPVRGDSGICRSLVSARTSCIGDRDRRVNAWLATPVHLEARLDHVRLAGPRPAASRRVDERDELARGIRARRSARSTLLHDARRARVPPERTARDTASPASIRRGCSDADIGPCAAGRDGRELRRLWTEIEMWLHGAPFNTARERARKRRVSALWLWGGGVGRAHGARWRVEPCARRTRCLRRRSDDLSALAGSPVTRAAFRSQLAHLDAGATHVVVELRRMSGPKRTNRWRRSTRTGLRPARVGAWQRVTLESVDLVANDRWFRIAARPRWRFWRRRRLWLASLPATCLSL